MSNYYSGQQGSLWFCPANASYPVPVKAGQVTNWSIQVSQSALDTTVLEDTDTTFINGLRTTTGNCRLYYYGTNSSASQLIRTILLPRQNSNEPGIAASTQQNVIFKLKVDGAGEIEAEALITSGAMAMSIGEVLAVDIEFQVQGAIKSVTI